MAEGPDYRPLGDIAAQLANQGRYAAALDFLHDTWKTNANAHVSDWEASCKAWREAIRQTLVAGGLIYPGSTS